MPETFTPKTWVDGSGGGTPITAAELNRVEQGVESMDDRVTALEDSVGVAGGVASLDGTGHLEVTQAPTVLHASAPDLNTSGHPASVVAVTSSGMTYVSGSNAQAAISQLDAGIATHTHPAITQHASLTDLATSGHAAGVITYNPTGNLHTAATNVQSAISDLDGAIGGGGGSGAVRSSFLSGGWYGAAWQLPNGGGTFGAASLPGNTLRAVPFILESAHDFTDIGIEVTTAGAAGSIIRIGVYFNSNGYPSTLKFAGTATLDSTATGGLTTSIPGANQTFAAGVYWMVAQAEVSAPTVRTITALLTPVASTSFPTGTGGTAAGYSVAGSAGSLTSPFPSGATAIAAAPRILLKAA